MSQVTPQARQFRHPILGAFGWFVFAYLMVNIVGTGAIMIEPNDAERQQLWLYGLVAAGGVFAALMFHLIHRQQGLRGFIRSGSFRLGAILIIPGLLYSATGLLAMTMGPTATTTLLSLQAGVSEEIMFRAIPIAYLMRAYKFDEKKIPLVVYLTGGFFGLFHMTNMFLGAGLGISIYQSLCCVCIGILFGAVYVRSGNILWCIIGHVLQDFIAFLNEEAVSESGIMTDITWSVEYLTSFAVVAVLAVFGIIYIRKSKRAEIAETWKKIWSYDDKPVSDEPTGPVELSEAQ